MACIDNNMKDKINVYLPPVGGSGVIVIVIISGGPHWGLLRSFKNVTSPRNTKLELSW